MNPQPSLATPLTMTMMIMMIRVCELGVDPSASRLGLVKGSCEYDKKPLDSITLDNVSTNEVKFGFETAMLFLVVNWLYGKTKH